MAAAAAPIAAISAPVEPQVGKRGLFSAGTVVYWKSSASLVKKRSSPVSGSSGKGSSSCSLVCEGFKAWRGNGRVGTGVRARVSRVGGARNGFWVRCEEGLGLVCV